MNTPASDAPVAALPAAEAIRSDRAAETGRGIALMVLAVGLFAIMDALVKWLGPTYPTLQLVFFRNLFAFVPLAVYMLRAGSLTGLRTRRPFAHAVRALVGLASLSCLFYAFAHMPLADVVAISFAAPLFVTALAVPLLGEVVGRRRWTAVLVGFLGVLIMIRPDAGVLEPVAIVALAGTVGYALVMIFVRKLSRTESSAAIVFYYSLSSTLIAGAFMPFQWVTPNAEDLVLLIAVGLVGGLAQITVTNAFRLADVSVVAPFDYTAMIWAALLGFFVWGDMPELNIWIGVAVVVASGVYIARRETRLGLPRGIARRLHARR
ncbi:MAG: DMT family transporter [Kiloniellaceae bacterium]